MKYQIWSNVSYRLKERSIEGYSQFLDGYRPDALMEMSFEGDIHVLKGPVEAALEGLFIAFNEDDRPNGATAHSLSVGDVVKLGDDAWSVDMIGFSKLDKFEPVLRQKGVESA